jgi:hypothetical protein
VRQIDVNSFEKVQKAVKDRIAAIETRAPCRGSSFRSFGNQTQQKSV